MSKLQPAKNQHGFFADAVHVFFLSSLALAQPLFDVLSRGAEFFVARQSGPLDIVLFAVFVSFLIPSSIVAIEAIFKFFGNTCRKALHHAFVAIAAAIFFLLPIKRLESMPDAAQLAAAGMTGAFAAWAYARFRPMRGRFALIVLSIIVVLFPGFFLLGSRVSNLVAPDSPGALRGRALDTSTPVVMIVFDELSTIALLDENRMIDSIRYPNIAAFAHHSTWFRNATTVADFTTIAIPAMLTGRYPTTYDLRLPTAADHPDNMFELFSRSHKMAVYESRTAMHDGASGDNRMPGLSQRLSGLLSDTALVYLHIISTPALSRRLSPITHDWTNFRPADESVHQTESPDDRTESPDDRPGSPTKAEEFRDWFKDIVQEKPFNRPQDRDRQFQKLIASIGPSEEPSFFFLHSLFPHTPYDRLPSGKIFTTDRHLEGLASQQWTEEERPVIQAHQRYLLQVRYVDNLIGELIERLKAADLYERSLVIVTSDHGVSFRPGDARRKVTATNYCDIIGVPLLIKAPYQAQALVKDTNVETIDILPTIADILDFELAWTTDGRSALSGDLLGRNGKTVFSGEVAEKERLTFPSSLEGSCPSLGRQLELFGSGGDDLFGLGPFKELIGRDVNEFDLSQVAAGKAELDQQALYQSVRPDSTYVPSMVKGKLAADGKTMPDNPLAISVNGKIRAVVNTDLRGGERYFSAVVPESSFVKGRNDLSFYAVSRVEGSLQLSRFVGDSDTSYSLVRRGPEGTEAIMTSSGSSIKLIPHALSGYLELAEVNGDFLQVSGWATDIRHSRLVRSVLVFVDGHVKYQGPTSRRRPDLARVHGESVANSGFRYTIPLRYLGDPAKSEIRVFALSEDDIAAELTYYTGYKWGRRFELELDQDGKAEALLGLGGRRVPVVEGSVQGELFVPKIGKERLPLNGWAADVTGLMEAEAIVFFLNGKFFYCGRINVQRESIRKRFNNDAFLWSGFVYQFPLQLFQGLDNSEIRVFAVSSRGTASEIGHLDGLPEAEDAS